MDSVIEVIGAADIDGLRAELRELPGELLAMSDEVAFPGGVQVAVTYRPA